MLAAPPEPALFPAVEIAEAGAPLPSFCRRRQHGRKSQRHDTRSRSRTGYKPSPVERRFPFYPCFFFASMLPRPARFLGFFRASFVLRLEIAANLSEFLTGYGPPLRLNTRIRYNTRHETGKPARECLHLYALPCIMADRKGDLAGLLLLVTGKDFSGKIAFSFLFCRCFCRRSNVMFCKVAGARNIGFIRLSRTHESAPM